MRATGFAARLYARFRTALLSEPCPYWTDYLHQKSRDQ